MTKAQLQALFASTNSQQVAVSAAAYRELTGEDPGKCTHKLLTREQVDALPGPGLSTDEKDTDASDATSPMDGQPGSEVDPQDFA